MLLQRIFLRFYFPLPPSPPPPPPIISATRARHDSLETLFETLDLPLPPPPPRIIKRNKKRVFFFHQNRYANIIPRGIIVFLSFPERGGGEASKDNLNIDIGWKKGEKIISVVFRDPFAYPAWQPPLLVHLRLAHWLSRNNHDPRADSVPYFQQLIRLPGRRRRGDLRFVAFTRGELQAGTGYRYSSLNVYRVVCASNSAADLRFTVITKKFECKSLSLSLSVIARSQ